MPWTPFVSGASLNTPGSEDGTIVRDEECDGFSRITLERETPHVPFAITCGIYGWMVHTRFFGAEAKRTSSTTP